MGHRLSFAEPLFGPDYTKGIVEHSGKMVLLLHILRECRRIGDRITVFSQSIPTLNAIQTMLDVYNETKKEYERINALRIDGSTPQALRFTRIAQFNDPDEEVDVILISTRAGGEGQYVVVSSVYDLQVKKEGVSKRVVDNTALERKFQKLDVKKYFDIHDFKDAQTKLLKHDNNNSTTSITSSSSTSHSSQPTTDQVLNSVLATRSSFLAEWFEQESMFEENMDERCSALEQEEAWKENEISKAARGIRYYQVDSAASIKRVICTQCNQSNPVTDVDLE
ncbi:hypothetical protein AaE_005765, partial [Aphanomyces astaci]